MDYTKCLLIHNSDYYFNNLFTNEIKFDFAASFNSNIDEFISNKLDELLDKDFEVIIIKESLSSNYLDFFGLLFATHIRLTISFGKKRFSPIIIVGDIDIDLINRLSTFSNILYTPNIYYVFHDDYFNLEIIKSQIEFAAVSPIKINEDNFKELFLNKINITIPKENLSKHSISNEWAIYKWSKALSIDSDVHLNFLEKHVKSSLYFKYLNNLYNLEIESLRDINYKFTFENRCNILYLDDEAEKGWGTILNTIFNSINFDYLGKDFKDKTSEEIVLIALEKISSFQPEIIILDLRLCDDDFRENRSVEELTGTVILNKIKEINPGIQCIIFSATSKSIILNHLFNIGILGFIKKDSPEENYLSSEENIKSFNNLLKKGIYNKYLIKIYVFVNNMKNHLSKSFNDFTPDDIIFLKEHVLVIFEILNSENSNRFNYAMITIYKCLEIIKDSLTQVSKSKKSVFVLDNFIRRRTCSSKNKGNKDYLSTANRLHICIEEKLCFLSTDNEYTFIDIIKTRRNNYIHPEANFISTSKEEILEWTELLQNIIIKLN